jgi:TetR/AcrR family transcriptional regulator, ethionamide resistance regulator
MSAGPSQPGEGTAPTLSRRARRMKQAPRRAGDRNEAALLEQARLLLLSGDFQKTPIREIAKLAGISRQSFYFYYQSKEELLAQLVTETILRSQGWRESFSDADWSDPAAAIRRIVDASVTNWREQREVLGAASEMAPRAPVILDHWREAAEDSADFLVDKMCAATSIDSVRDREETWHLLMLMMWMLERNCYMHMVHGTDESDAAFSERISTVYIRTFGLE